MRLYKGFTWKFYYEIDRTSFQSEGDIIYRWLQSMVRSGLRTGLQGMLTSLSEERRQFKG